MTTAERAFTFSPGHSLLHKWSQRDGKAPGSRLLSKVAVFFTVEASITRLYEHFSFANTMMLDLAIIAAAIACLAVCSGSAKVRSVSGELISVVKLTVVVGVPVFGVVVAVATITGIDVGYTLVDVPRVFMVLAGMVAGLLAVAAVLMSTTSLADVVFLIPGRRGRLRTFVALALISLARAEPELVTRLIAIDALQSGVPGSWPMRWITNARRYPGRVFQLLATIVWQIVAVSSIPIYLTLCSEMDLTDETGRI